MSSSERPRALVYRGPTASSGCSEALAELLESSPSRFEVSYAGPHEAIKISAESLSKVDLYAHPGGPDLDDAWKEAKPYASAMREFVAKGGRYIGVCLGAYLAGYSPGFKLLPKGADTDSENEQKGSQVTHDEDTIIQVDWTFMAGPRAGQTVKDRWIFFQEGAVIQGLKQTEDSFVIARYSKSRGVAASLTKYGEGWVGLVGPHPEATPKWFSDYDIHSPDGLQYEIGHDLIEATMAGGSHKSHSRGTSK